MIQALRFSTTTLAALAICLVATALFFGDIAWAHVFLTAIVLRSRPEFRSERLLLMACSLFWLAMFRWILLRQLFFPYTMHLAACAMLFASSTKTWQDYARGMIIVAVFTAIRFLQGAPHRVLVIESIVAAIILAFAVGFYQLTPRNAASRAVVVVLSSLAAVAGLAI